MTGRPPKKIDGAIIRPENLTWILGRPVYRPRRYYCWQEIGSFCI